MVQAQVDRTQVPENQSVNLTLESDGAGGSPDLSAVKRDFDVLGTNESNSFELSNGAVSQKSQWHIELMPRRAGKLVIPPIAVGSERSAPIALTVLPAGQTPGGAAARQPQDLFLEATVDPHQAYVQQQLRYTLRLFHAVNLGNGATLADPSFPSGVADVEKLGADRQYDTTRDGRQYAVFERSYALFPQQAGPLAIPPVTFEGDVVVGGSVFGIDPFGSDGHHVRLRSPALSVAVKPQPAAFTGPQWLPARGLHLDERWSQPPATFTLGQPITRTLTLTATGVQAAQLPALDTPVQGLKQYPDRPTLKNQTDERGLTGVRQETVAMIPTHAGPLTLPAIEVPWWNTTTDRLESATLPARVVKVSAAAGRPACPAGSRHRRGRRRHGAHPGPAEPPAPAGPWRWLAILNGAGWLATLLAWGWWARRLPARGQARTRTNERSEPRGPSTARLERELEVSCRANDAPGARTALLAWARATWPDHPPMSLTAVARRCPPELAEALVALDRALYAPSATPWQGNALWERFGRHLPATHATRPSGRLELEPLYPG